MTYRGLVSLSLLFLSAGCGESFAPAMSRAPAPLEHEGPGELSAAVPANGDSGAQPSVADKSEAVVDEQPAPAPEPAQAERTRDISFDDVKFDIEKGEEFKRSSLTDKIEALDGKPIRIRGYILPSFQQSGLTQFVLVRDNLSCCFGPGAAIYDCVIVEMKPGKSTDYSLYPVAVEGTFAIREMLDPDGKTVAIYHLDGESVR
jgi:hypothetical protein